ncbi:hypothetical protein, partial [Longispora fulva]|uniref:hypothetical protein n=2 Tax=Bacteria TaxID=2 RepID=UPI0036290D15
MKTIRPIFFALLLSNLLLSCSKDDDTESPTYLVVADLFEDTSIMENSSATEFRINLNEPAQEDGYIILKVTSTKNNGFQTNPPV